MSILFSSRRSQKQLAWCAAAVALLLYLKPSRRYFHVPEPARSILAEASSWTLYALDPAMPSTPLEDERLFRGFRILGQAELTDQGLRDELTYEFNWGVITHSASSLCWRPRHGIRAETPSGTVDVIICFSCSGAHFAVDGEPKIFKTDTSRNPAPTFNRIFEGAGLSIAP